PTRALPSFPTRRSSDLRADDPHRASRLAGTEEFSAGDEGGEDDIGQRGLRAHQAPELAAIERQDRARALRSPREVEALAGQESEDRKSTRLNSSHVSIS